MGASEPDPGSLPDSISAPPPRLPVDVVRRASGWDGAVEDALLTDAANAAFHAAANGRHAGEVSLLLSDDEEIRSLNRTWRGRDTATNVLSFPLDAPHTQGGERPLGDVALAYETVAREAHTRGIPVSQHAAHLVVHGVLHLLGYDHSDDAQAHNMETLEVQVLAGLGLPDPYALETMTESDAR